MFNYYGIGSFQPIEGTMHSPQYVEVFRRVVPELEKALQWFQDLSADLFLCHTSKMVKNFMAKNITILDWPGNPPDVYPIENFGPYAKVDFVLWTMDNYGKTHSSADSRMAQGSDNYK